MRLVLPGPYNLAVPLDVQVFDNEMDILVGKKRRRILNVEAEAF